MPDEAVLLVLPRDGDVPYARIESVRELKINDARFTAEEDERASRAYASQSPSDGCRVLRPKHKPWLRVISVRYPMALPIGVLLFLHNSLASRASHSIGTHSRIDFYHRA